MLDQYDTRPDERTSQQSIRVQQADIPPENGGITTDGYCYIETRVCWMCKQEKHRSEFYRDRNDKYGLQACCKPCTRAKNREWKLQHPGYFKQKGKEKYRREENPERYARYRESYIARRRIYGATLSGRIHALLTSARSRAAKRGLEFTLTFEELAEMYRAQNGCCLLTRLPLDLEGRNTKRRRAYLPFSPSLDRIDPNEGYTRQNVRLVCTAINIARNHFGDDVLTVTCAAYLQTQGYLLDRGIGETTYPLLVPRLVDVTKARN